MQQPDLAAALQEIVLEGHGALGSDAMFQWPNPEKFAELSPPAATQIGRIDAPTLAIIGELDLPDFHVQIDQLDEFVSNSTKLVIPGVGHMSSMEDPSSVNSALVEFFAAHPIIAEPNCDFDSNGTCDIGDLDSLLATGNLQEGIGVMVGVTDQFDLDKDDQIDTHDLDEWLSSAAAFNDFTGPYLTGDADLDGDVNSADLNTLALNWRQSATGWSAGDFTANGIVDAQDLNALAINWRAQLGRTNQMAVPEPSSSFLTILSLVVLVQLRKPTGRLAISVA